MRTYRITVTIDIEAASEQDAATELAFWQDFGEWPDSFVGIASTDDAIVMIDQETAP